MHTKDTPKEDTKEIPTAVVSENGNGLDRDDSQGHLHQKSPVNRKLVSRLQEAIDDRGRYSYRLKDLSIGYAAAKGISEVNAKKEIDKMFQNEMGQSLQSYLECHRRELGLSVEPRKSR